MYIKETISYNLLVLERCDLMNNGYYNPTYPTNNGISQQDISGDLPMEQSYVENILRLNKGKVASIYMSFPDSTEWRNKIFTGVIEQAARDHVVLSDPTNGKWYLLLSIYMNYIIFDEKINYKVI